MQADSGRVTVHCLRTSGSLGSLPIPLSLHLEDENFDYSSLTDCMRQTAMQAEL